MVRAPRGKEPERANDQDKKRKKTIRPNPESGKLVRDVLTRSVWNTTKRRLRALDGDR